jgi:molybdenum cofactor synthesis domain-containing protein
MDSGSRLYRKDPKSRWVSKVKPAPRVLHGKSGPVHAELLSVGREILRGQVAERNAGYLAGELSRQGVVVHRITVVDDNDRAITAAVVEALQRGAKLLVINGGLGPTSDDRTLGAVADALGVPLEIQPRAREMVEAAFRRLKAEGKTPQEGLTRAREKMCAVPRGSEPVRNNEGISPGVIARLPSGSVVVCLPGVPCEMQAVWEELTPALREFRSRFKVAVREVEAPTADESILQPWLDLLHAEFPNVWIKTHSPGFAKKGQGIRVTFEAHMPTLHEAELAVEGALRRLLALAGAG